MNAPFSFYGRFVDTLQNVISGLGTPRDKSYHTAYTFSVLSRAVLEAAYRGDWMARKVIDAPVEDSTREWRAWQADGDAIEKIEKAEKELQLLKRVAKVMKQARLYGGAALILGVDGQGDASRPLDVEKVKQDQLKFIHVVASHEISVEGVEQDLTKPEYGEPLMYQSVSIGGVQQVRIHPSRVIRFVGKELPNERELGPAAWGDSILQAVDDAIRAAGTVLMSGAALVNDAKVDVIKVPDLSTNLTTSQYADRFTSRVMLANQMKSVINTLVVDKEEEWARMQTSFAGMDELFKLYLLVASGAADIPATRLLGQSPQGMNATGESDIRNYYDRLRSEQETEITPALERLDEVLIRSATGTRDENIFYEWNPLWQLTDAERADVAVKKSQVMSADVAAGLIPLEVLRIGRQNQLVEDGFYPGIEVAIEEHEDEPSPAEENRQVANEMMEAKAANENSFGGEEDDEEEAAFGDHTLGDSLADAKESFFTKVGPNQYKRKGGKGKIYNFEQVKLWYALHARGQAWDGADEILDDDLDLEDHTPGGHDHDQDKHGNEGGAAVKVTEKKLPRHGEEMTINQKVVKKTHLELRRGDEKLGTVESIPGSRQTVVSGSMASGRGEVVRWRAEPAGERSVYFGKRADAVNYVKKRKGVADEDRRALDTWLNRDAYDPKQPRDPKGSQTGGRWTKRGTTESGDPSGGLQGYLETVSQFQRQNFPNDSELTPMEWELRHGRPFVKDARSYEGKRGKQHQCYMNAGRAALYDSDLTYVEGHVAVHGVPLEHAWLTDKTGRLIDPTIKDGEGITGYWGVPIKTSYLRETVMKNKVWGVLGFESGYEHLKRDPKDVVKTDLSAKDHSPVEDAQPRTLYVRRDVKNAGAIINWAKSQGFKTTIPASKMHVTVAFSRAAVDWMVMGQAYEDDVTVSDGGPRLLERFGDAVVLSFASSALSWRHEEMKNRGASWDHDQYQPHVTISWDAADLDLSKVEPYRGKIVLGPEIFEEVKESWKESITEDYSPTQPREPKGAPESKGGQFAKSTGASSTVASDLLKKNHDDSETVEDVYREIPQDVKDKMRQAQIENSALTPTAVTHKLPDGTYTPERQELHNQILSDMFPAEVIARAQPAPGEKRSLIMLGGRPAAGKTSTLAGEVGDRNHFYLSADEIQEKLPGYAPHLAQIFNQEGQDLALRAEHIARERGMNLLYDATLKTASSAHERVAAYKAAGYDVEGHFVHTTPKTSALRSAQRFAGGGRFVPIEVSFNSRTNESTFDSLIPQFSRWSIYDNNGRKPKLVARSK